MEKRYGQQILRVKNKLRLDRGKNIWLKWLHNDLGTGRVLILISLFILGCFSSVGSVIASQYLILNADALGNVFLAGDNNGRLYNVFVQEQHTLLLKFPLFWLQSLIEYSTKNFYFFNVVSSLITAVLWCVLLAWALGRKYLPLLALALSVVFGSSLIFNIDITYTTVRNIEFITSLFFVIALARYIFKIGRHAGKLLIAGSLLFVVTLATDSFFLYVYAGGVGLALLYRIVIKPTNKDYIAILALIASVIGASLLKKLVDATGLLSLDITNNITPTTVRADLLIPSIGQSVHQTLILFGADVFDKQISLSFLVAVCNLLLLIFGIYGFFWYLRSKKHSPYQRFIVISLLATCITTYASYILGDRVFHHDGPVILSSEAERFLTSVVLVLPLGIALGFFNLHEKLTPRVRQLLQYGVLSLITISLLFGLAGFLDTYREAKASTTPARTAYTQIAENLSEEGVDVFLSGHWYGASTRFWGSQGTDKTPPSYGIVNNCYVATSMLVNKQWFKPNPTVKRSAIILEPNTSCPPGDPRLREVYGTPIKSLALTGANGEQLTVEIFGYDIRSRVNKENLR